MSILCRWLPIRIRYLYVRLQFETSPDARGTASLRHIRDIPHPTRNHPARFSGSRRRGENLKSWRAHFAGPDVRYPVFQVFSFPARSVTVKICPDAAHPTPPPPSPGGRDQNAPQLHRVTRSRTFPTRAFSAPRCPLRSAHGDCICTSVRVSKRYRNSKKPFSDDIRLSGRPP
jgi:hypothetical protein